MNRKNRIILLVSLLATAALPAHAEPRTNDQQGCWKDGRLTLIARNAACSGLRGTVVADGQAFPVQCTHSAQPRTALAYQQPNTQIMAYRCASATVWQWYFCANSAARAYIEPFPLATSDGRVYGMSAEIWCR